MSEVKHTPGQWTADIGTRGCHINVGNDYNHPLSFGFEYSEFDKKQREQGQANARLIAAAPEILELLIEAKEVLNASSRASNWQEILTAKINTTIKKATE